MKKVIISGPGIKPVKHRFYWSPLANSGLLKLSPMSVKQARQGDVFILSHDKANKMACTPCEDSEQPVYLPSLISLHCAHQVNPLAPITLSADDIQYFFIVFQRK